ncbi:Glycosyl transferase family 2 [uncultured archaeon]|nr:Glycosyl transferase family 2 [uncultured archaeon]
MESGITAIICSKDRPDLLKEVVADLLKQSVFPDRIIVVDNSKSEENHAVGESEAKRILGGNVPLTYAHDRSGLGLPHARNVGKQYAKGGIVLFLDDDVLLDADYTRNLSQFYKDHPNAGGACGNLRQPADERLSSQLRILFGTVFLFDGLNPFRVLPSGWGSHPYGAAKTGKVDWLSGCNMSYRKAVLDEFDSDEKVPSQGGGEDRDLSFRVSRKYPVYVVAECKGIHKMISSSRPSLAEMNKRALYGNSYFYKKNVKKSMLTHAAFWWSTFGYFLKTFIQILLTNCGPKAEQIGILFSSLSLIA